MFFTVESPSIGGSSRQSPAVTNASSPIKLTSLDLCLCIGEYREWSLLPPSGRPICCSVVFVTGQWSLVNMASGSPSWSLNRIDSGEGVSTVAKQGAGEHCHSYTRRQGVLRLTIWKSQSLQHGIILNACNAIGPFCQPK